LIIMLLVYSRPIAPAIVMLPLLLLLQGLLATGLGLIIATLNVFYRDIQHFVGVVLSLLFYLVPVFYRPQSVVGQYHFVYDLNPIAVLIQGYRAIFFYREYPNGVSLLFACITSLVVYGLGLLIYGSRQHDIVDMI
jgi:lipopolysaccharide transport system permease protein